MAGQTRPVTVYFGKACAGIVAATDTGPHLAIESGTTWRQVVRVKAKAKRQAKSEGAVLDHATNNLLRALKQDMRKQDGRMDFDKLHKDDYSDCLLAKLEQV